MTVTTELIHQAANEQRFNDRWAVCGQVVGLTTALGFAWSYHKKLPAVKMGMLGVANVMAHFVSFHVWIGRTGNRPKYWELRESRQEGELKVDVKQIQDEVKYVISLCGQEEGQIQVTGEGAEEVLNAAKAARKRARVRIQVLPLAGLLGALLVSSCVPLVIGGMHWLRGYKNWYAPVIASANVSGSLEMAAIWWALQQEAITER